MFSTFFCQLFYSLEIPILNKTLVDMSLADADDIEKLAGSDIISPVRTVEATSHACMNNNASHDAEGINLGRGDITSCFLGLIHEQGQGLLLCSA